MKKRYEAPEWEMVTVSARDDILMSSSCPTNCSDDCAHCFYLVCEPQDVIIGG